MGAAVTSELEQQSPSKNIERVNIVFSLNPLKLKLHGAQPTSHLYDWLWGCNSRLENSGVDQVVFPTRTKPASTKFAQGVQLIICQISVYLDIARFV